METSEKPSFSLIQNHLWFQIFKKISDVKIMIKLCKTSKKINQLVNKNTRQLKCNVEDECTLGLRREPYGEQTGENVYFLQLGINRRFLKLGGGPIEKIEEAEDLGLGFVVFKKIFVSGIVIEEEASHLLKTWKLRCNTLSFHRSLGDQLYQHTIGHLCGIVKAPNARVMMQTTTNLPEDPLWHAKVGPEELTLYASSISVVTPDLTDFLRHHRSIYFIITQQMDVEPAINRLLKNWQSGASLGPNRLLDFVYVPDFSQTPYSFGATIVFKQVNHSTFRCHYLPPHFCMPIFPNTSNLDYLQNLYLLPRSSGGKKEVLVVFFRVEEIMGDLGEKWHRCLFQMPTMMAFEDVILHFSEKIFPKIPIDFSGYPLFSFDDVEEMFN